MSAPTSQQKGTHRGNLRLSTGVRLAVGVALLATVFWSIDLRDVASKFSSDALDPVFFALLCLVATCDRVLMAYKWNLLLRARGLRISTGQAIRLYYIGHLMGTFTPGAIGGDAYRVTALSHFRQSHLIISSVLLERLIGLAVIILFAAVGLPISLRYLNIADSWLYWGVIGGGVGVVAATLLSLHPPAVRYLVQPIVYFTHSTLVRRVGEFYRIYAQNREQWPALLVFTLLSAVEVVLTVGITYMAARSLGLEISFGFLICVMPLLYILLRLPISVQGIGVQEGLFAFFAVAAGYSAADGLSISILLRIAEIFLTFIPAAFMLWFRPFKVVPDTKSV